MDGLNEDELKLGVDTLLEDTDLSKIIVDNSNVVMIIWSLEGKLIKFNKYAQALTGFSQDEVIGHKWRGRLITEEQCPKINKLFDGYRVGKVPPEHEGKLLTKEKQVLDILWINHVIRDAHNSISCGISIGMNITETKRNQRKLQESYEELKSTQWALEKTVLYDTLTGLPNAVFFHQTLTELLVKCEENKSSFALLLMDLDNFKNINDTLGHTVGDRLLRNVSEKILKYIDGSCFFGRFGGDEFVFLIEYINEKSEVEKLSDAIINIFSKSLDIDGYSLNVTASLGASLYPEGGHNGEELFKNADIALNRSKELGKNQFCVYSAELNTRIIERALIEQDLKKALENGEFEVYYQPQIDAVTGGLTGAEALVRWKHPQKGMISPAKFIPVAEETGAINLIGEWVLRNACRQMKCWQDRGINNVKISVNLSLRQLHDKDFMNKVRKIIMETEIIPGSLILEITESIAMHDVSNAVELLKELRKLGISIALDDFGTGYSSLNYLTLLPINCVKLDRAFMEDLIERHEKQIVAKAIIDLAHNLDLYVVAEGVETKEQLDMLMKYHCNLIQGFYFSKPLSKEEFELKYCSAG